MFAKKSLLTCKHFRSIISYNFRSGLSRQECIDDLKSSIGDKAAYYSTVKNWFHEFNCARQSLKDEAPEGPAKKAHYINFWPSILPVLPGEI